MSDFYLSNITGMLDVDSMVKGLLYVKHKKIKELNNKKALLQAKAASISNLLGSLKEVKNFIESWDISSLFKGKRVSVDNPEVLSASVTEETPNLSMKVKVTQLPQAEIRISSSGVSSLEESLSYANFTIRYYTSDTNYEEFNINFEGGTLKDLVNLINQAQDKIEASIYYDGTYYKLMLSEKNMGASTKETSDTSSVIEITSGALPSELSSLDTIQKAKNAKLLIGDGSEVVSPTTTFKNILQGMDINVKDLGETNITISDDYSKVSSGIGELFEKINGVIDLANTLTEKGSPFQGNAIITQIKPQIFRTLNHLISLGVVNIDDSGKYSVNTEIATELAKNEPDKIKRALENVKQGIDRLMEGLTKTFQFYKNTQDNMIERINEDIKKMQETIAKEEVKLRKEFSKIEALMYNNEALKERLKSFVVTLTEANKK